MSRTPKRRPALDPNQLGFSFDVPIVPKRDSDLYGLDRRVSSAVGLCLKDDERSREEIAGAMSALLGDEVTKGMLDAYASEAREGHSISFHRFLALIAVTRRHDILDKLSREIGAAVLVGEDLLTARLGDLRTRVSHFQKEIRELERRATPIGIGK